jgi:hypothetical protein
MNASDQDWSAEERSGLEALRVEQTPPEALEAAVVSALVERGLVRRASVPFARWFQIAAALAAAACLFSAGLFVGSRPGRSPGRPDRPRYLLLLEGADTLTPEEEARRVVEYRAWAHREAGAGRLLSGEKLEPAARTLGVEPARSGGGESVRGFFIIVAKDDAEALAIAHGCPHLAHGGRVVVRRIATS